MLNVITHTASSIVIGVLWLVFCGDGHETLQDRRRKVMALNLGLFAGRGFRTKKQTNRKQPLLLHGPAECIECKHAQFHIVIAVCAALKEKLSELRNVLPEERDFLRNQMSNA